jgi:hypothetical protein
VPRPNPPREWPFEFSGSQYAPLNWADIPGWNEDDHLLAFQAFRTSCKPIVAQSKPAMDSKALGTSLRDPCRAARAHEISDGGKARTFANLRDKGETYQITLPEFVDPETGDLKKITVAPLVNQEQVFIWSRPDLEQWASIFIEGEYPARTNDAGEIVKKASSKNVIQARIMKAQNFKGSPIETLLKTNGKGLDIPDAETEPEDTGLDDTDETTKIPGQTDPVKAAPTGADADAALAAALGG